MENKLVLRLALLVLGLIGFSQAEEDRMIQIKIGNDPVYRSAYYVLGSTARLNCIAPKNTKSDELAIYQDNSTSPLCKWSDSKSMCFKLTSPDQALAVDIRDNGLYTCKYDKAPEPPVKQAEVRVYFKKSNMQVFDEHDQSVTDVSKVRNETLYKLVCPDGPSGAQSDTKVRWYRNEHELKLDHHPYYDLNDTTQALVFKKVKNPDASKFGGWYRCERMSKENQPLSLAFFKIPSYAHASAASKSYNKMEGESATLSCDVEGEPVPEVSWKRNDKVIVPGSDNDRFTSSSYKGIPGASLTIKNLAAEDYGEYVCMAKGGENSYAEAPTLLRVRSKLAALWPFLGIVAEVILLVAIIFIYEKRRAKKEQEENEDNADQKKSLTASNNENKDIRQRKA